jgi:hypothetical protein
VRSTELPERNQKHGDTTDSSEETSSSMLDHSKKCPEGHR